MLSHWHACYATLQLILMSTYLYELPTTGAISFADFCVDQTASHSTALASATQARANLRAALKESKRVDSEKDYLKLVKVRAPLLCSEHLSDLSFG